MRRPQMKLRVTSQSDLWFSPIRECLAVNLQEGGRVFGDFALAIIA